MKTCPICTRSATSPFRVYDSSSKVIMGCVSVFHNDRLVAPSESARWHYRPEAKRVRSALKRFAS